MNPALSSSAAAAASAVVERRWASPPPPLRQACRELWRRGLDELRQAGLLAAAATVAVNAAAYVLVRVETGLRVNGGDLLTRHLLDLLAGFNPQLTGDQRAHLQGMLRRAVDQTMWRGEVNVAVLRGIVALACPSVDAAALLEHLLDAVSEYVDTPKEEGGRARSRSPSPGLAGSPPRRSGDPAAAAAAAARGRSREAELVGRYGVEPEAVARLQSGGCAAVLDALGDCRGEAAQPPTCSITLEPVLSASGRVLRGTVALLQAPPGGDGQGPPHAFLYQGGALFEWLREGPAPTNPETRWAVRPSDIFRLA